MLALTELFAGTNHVDHIEGSRLSSLWLSRFIQAGVIWQMQINVSNSPSFNPTQHTTLSVKEAKLITNL